MVMEAGSASASPSKLVEAAEDKREKSQDGKNETK